MSRKPGTPRRTRRGPLQLVHGDRRARHLQLVSDQWLGELANRAAVLPLSRRGSFGRGEALRPAEYQPGPAPLEPA
jgi:hypothetical protein